jgi:hypothetical protein
VDTRGRGGMAVVGKVDLKKELEQLYGRLTKEVSVVEGRPSPAP